MVILLTSLTSCPVLACKEITGVYQSVSETHWSFELNINDDKAILTYTDHWFGVSDTSSEIKLVSSGYCKKLENDFLLTFAERTISIKYHKSLSHKSYGAEGSSPGISGEFIEKQINNLWLSQNDM